MDQLPPFVALELGDFFEMNGMSLVGSSKVTRMSAIVNWNCNGSGIVKHLHFHLHSFLVVGHQEVL
mgnify:CR=1 FL=1